MVERLLFLNMDFGPLSEDGSQQVQQSSLCSEGGIAKTPNCLSIVSQKYAVNQEMPESVNMYLCSM